MGLGQNAFTVASHLTLIAILGVLGYRMLSAKVSGLLHTALDRGLTAALTICALALAIERFYYVVARFLMPTGVNLWTMHPAPDVLSLIVAIGIYGIMVPVILAGSPSDARAWFKIIREVLIACSFWAITAWTLF